VHAATHRELIETAVLRRASDVTSPTPGSRNSTTAAATKQVAMSWLAERLRAFVDLNPEFETAVDRLASWLARLDSDSDSDADSGEEE